MTASGESDDDGRRSSRDGLLVFAAALLVRFIYLWSIRDIPFFDAPTVDGAYYDQWARRIAAGEWWGGEVFFLAPAYPYFLAVIYAIFGPNLVAVHGLQMVLGAGSCALLCGAGRRFFDRRAGLVAGMILAFYQPAIFYDGLLHKAGLLLFLTTLLFYLLSSAVDSKSWKRWLACGMVGGLLALTQENMLVLLAAVPAWILLRGRTVLAGAFAAGMVSLLLLVAVRNYAVGSVFAVTTSNVGQNFYIGNNPEATGLYEPLVRGRQNPAQEREDAIRLAEQSEGHALSPGEASTVWLRRGLDFVREQPGAWAQLFMRKLLLAWNRFEAPDADDLTIYAEWSGFFEIPAKYFHFGVLAPLGLAGIALVSRRSRGVGLLGAITGAITLAIALFFVFGRYRLPLVPILALFAGAGTVGAIECVRGGRRRPMIVAALTLVVAAIATNWPLVSERASHSVGWMNLGTALAERGRFDDAEGCLERAIEAYPDNALAHHQLGLVEQKQGRASEAEARFTRAAAIEPELAAAHLALARLLSSAGRKDEAVARYREVIRLSPTDETAREELRRLLGTEEPAVPPAADEFERLMRGASEAIETGRFVEAIRAFTDAAALRSDDARAHLGLAAALIAAKREGEAIPTLRRAVELDPRLSDAHAELGRFFADRGEFAAAIESDNRALALDPASISARYNLATALAASGQLDQAVEAMQTCLDQARTAKRSELIPRIEDRLARLRAERDRE